MRMRQTVREHSHLLLAESRRPQKPCRDVRFAPPRTCHRHVPTSDQGFSHSLAVQYGSQLNEKTSEAAELSPAFALNLS